MRYSDQGYLHLDSVDGRIVPGAECSIEIGGWGFEPYVIVSVDAEAKQVVLKHKYDEEEQWLDDTDEVDFRWLLELKPEDDDGEGARMMGTLMQLATNGAFT